MKKNLSLLFILIISQCYSATGNASDGELGALVVLAIIAILIGSGYFIDFLKRIIKNGTFKRITHRSKPDEDEDFGNTYYDENGFLSHVIPE